MGWPTLNWFISKLRAFINDCSIRAIDCSSIMLASIKCILINERMVN